MQAPARGELGGAFDWSKLLSELLRGRSGQAARDSPLLESLDVRVGEQ